MTTLYGFGALFDCRDPSPFVMKTMIQLQLLGVQYDEAMADLESVSKKKAPYVEDDGVIIEDSNFIRWYFEEKLGKSLLDDLTDQERAISWALERMVEDHVYKLTLMERWLKDDNFKKGPAMFFAGVPEPAREGVCKQVREDIRQYLFGEGFARHSEAERLALVARDVDAVAYQIGDKPFLLGDEPSVADAAVGAMLIGAATPFFDTPLVEMIASKPNLVAYNARIADRFF